MRVCLVSRSKEEEGVGGEYEKKEKLTVALTKKKCQMPNSSIPP